VRITLLRRCCGAAMPCQKTNFEAGNSHLPRQSLSTLDTSNLLFPTLRHADMSPVNSPLVHRLSPLIISLPLLLLFVSTAWLLFLSSDDNISAIWLQCSPTSISPFLPEISQLPLIGQVSCYMVTFFDYAVASSRAFAVMSVILSFVAALLTIVLVESARIANQPSILIRSPMATLLFFNLAGGAVAW
jgi:hypothetical protein